MKSYCSVDLLSCRTEKTWKGMYIRIAEFSVKRVCSSHEVGGLVEVSDVYIVAGSQLCSACKIAIYHVKTLFF